ncbi:MAG: hypothetical protein MI919_35770, partial [Holophagales bacterium]|nr:hypothetical protein [Holophagales bacterium]
MLVRRAWLDENQKITAVRISGRPEGRFEGKAQGGHVIAHAVFRDVLDSATLGRTVNRAHADGKTLIRDQKKLPGYAYIEQKKLPEDQPHALGSSDVESRELQKVMEDYLRHLSTIGEGLGRWRKR